MRKLETQRSASAQGVGDHEVSACPLGAPSSSVWRDSFLALRVFVRTEGTIHFHHGLAQLSRVARESESFSWLLLGTCLRFHVLLPTSRACCDGVGHSGPISIEKGSSQA